MKNHYEILEIPNLSSFQEIRKAYRRLALQHHPDRGGNCQKMKIINESYEFLLKNKKDYDELLNPPKRNFYSGITVVVGGFAYEIPI